MTAVQGPKRSSWLLEWRDGGLRDEDVVALLLQRAQMIIDEDTIDILASLDVPESDRINRVDRGFAAASGADGDGE